MKRDEGCRILALDLPWANDANDASLSGELRQRVHGYPINPNTRGAHETDSTVSGGSSDVKIRWRHATARRNPPRSTAQIHVGEAKTSVGEAKRGRRSPHLWSRFGRGAPRG